MGQGIGTTVVGLSSTIDAAIAAQAAPIDLLTFGAAGGGLRPIDPDTDDILIVGSSSASGLSTYIISEASGALWTATITNAAQGGERYAHTLARLGIAPALLTFTSNTIPASGAATVTTNLPTNYGLKSYPGTASGVAGTLSLSGGVFTFTRTTAGGAVTLDGPVPFIPTASSTHYAGHPDAVLVADLGKNDADDAGGSTYANIAIDLVKSRAHPLFPRMVLLGQFANRGSSAAHKANIAAVNAHRSAMAAADPTRVKFVDIAAYLAGSDVWDHTSITPTGTDTTNQAAGELPVSLSSDTQHMNAATYQAVTEHLIMPALGDLIGTPYAAPNSIIASDGFAGDGALNARVADNALGGVSTLTWSSSATFTTSGSALVTTDANSGTAGLPFDGMDDQDVTVTVTAPSTGTIVLCARMDTTAASAWNNMYRAEILSTGVVRLRGRYGGSDTAINDTATTVVANDTLTLRCIGNTISIRVNDVEVYSTTDTNVPTGNYVGVSKSTVSSGTTFKDFTARYLNAPDQLPA